MTVHVLAVGEVEGLQADAARVTLTLTLTLHVLAVGEVEGLQADA